MKLRYLLAVVGVVLWVALFLVGLLVVGLLVSVDLADVLVNQSLPKR